MSNLKYQEGLTILEKIFWSIIAVILFFLIFNEIYERIYGYGRWWDVIDKPETSFIINSKGGL